MSDSNFFFELKTRLPGGSWPWVLLSLRQDGLVWKALQNSDLGLRALETLSSQPESWNPAALALVALGNPVQIDGLRSSPMQPVEPLLQGQLSQALGEWIQNKNAPATLGKACLLALAARERLCRDVTWDELWDETGLKNVAAKSTLACLYGLIANPQELLDALTKPGDQRPQPNLAMHVLLAYPQPEQSLLKILRTMLADMPVQGCLSLLEELVTSRPWIAVGLAKQYIDEWMDSLLIEAQDQDDGDIQGQIGRLVRLLQMAQVHQFADQPDGAVPHLSEAIRSVRRIRGHLFAKLAQALTRGEQPSETGDQETVEETSLEAWKQAVHLVPDAPRYSAGLARRLMDMNRFSDASAYLEGRKDDDRQHEHPVLLVASAQLLKTNGELAEARETALQALEMVENDQELDYESYYDLIRLFQAEGMYEEVARTAEHAIRKYPLNIEFLALLAQAQMHLHQPRQALANVYTAQAIEAVSPPKISHERDENKAQLNHKDLQRLLVESLEAADDWQAALGERRAMLVSQDSPSSDDLRALAYCAIRAGEPDQAVKICRDALQVDPEDIESHQLLAEAYIELGEHLTAIEHLDHATRLAPTQAKLWMTLARAQKASGEGEKALDTLRAASKAVPTHPSVHLSLGEEYLQRGEPTQALGSFRQASSLDPNDERIALRLGQTLNKLGHLKEARRVLQGIYDAEINNERKLAEIPDQELTYAYAQTLLGLGDLSSAISLLKEVVRHQPENPGANLDLATALMQVEDQPAGVKRAIPFLERILGLTDDDDGDGRNALVSEQPALHAEAMALLAEAYTRMENYDGAMRAYRWALESPVNRDSSRRTRLAAGLGQIALKLDQPETALAALQDAAHAEPLNPEVQRALSDAYLANGLLEEASQAAMSALDLNSSGFETISWFVDQWMPLYKHPGVRQLPIWEELLKALQSAVHLAPSRGDLLLRLGEVLIERGDRDAGIEAFSELASTGEEIQGLKVEDLYRAARTVRTLGKTEITIALLRRAIDLSESEEPSKEILSSVSRVDLFNELALAYESGEDLEIASQTLDRAISLDPENVSLFQHKSDLLFESGRLEEARDCLKQAVDLAPTEASLRYRMALTLRLLGDLPPALEHIDLAIVAAAESSEDGIEYPARLLGAELAYVLLKPQQARTYLEDGLGYPPSEFKDFKHASLHAELALYSGDEQSAARAVKRMRELAPRHPRCLANRSRLAGLQGDPAEALKLFGTALDEVNGGGLTNGLEGIGKDPSSEVMTLLAVSQAALDTFQWEEAISASIKLVENAPSEPLSHLRLAQALVLRAEAKSLCLDLDVIQNAPGEGSLSDEARRDFERVMGEAEYLARGSVADQVYEALDWWDDETKQVLTIWLARGRAAFQPDLHSAQTLWRVLKAVVPKPEIVASLIMAYRKSGDPKEAINLVNLGWHPIYGDSGISLAGQPLVMTQLALAVAEVNLEQGLDIAEDSLARAAGTALGQWPEVVMIQYLIARLAHQIGEHAKALGAIQGVLATWSEEPRWHALAAQIYLADDPSAGLPDPDKARQHLELAASLEPDYAPHQLALGSAYLEDGQALHAMQSLESASRLQPDMAEAWLRLSQAQHMAGDLNGAASSAEIALERMPGSQEALVLRGQIALEKGDAGEALGRAQTVLKSQPGNPEALYLLARALEKTNRPDEALAALDKAMPLFENPFPLKFERVKLLRRSSGLESALADIQELAVQHPRQPELFATLSDWLQEDGKEDHAIQAARLALQYDHGQLSLEQRAGLDYLIGVHMRNAGQLDQAIHHLSAAVENSPDHMEAYLALGETYQERREHRQALKTYQKAINNTDADFRPYYHAGQVLKECKDYLAAEAMLRRAAQIAPDEVSVHRLLGAVVALNLVHNRKLSPS